MSRQEEIQNGQMMMNRIMWQVQQEALYRNNMGMMPEIQYYNNGVPLQQVSGMYSHHQSNSP